MPDEKTDLGHPVNVAEGAAGPAVGSLEDFFRTNYRGLLRRVGYLGATEQEAYDAVSAALEDVVRNWDTIKNPLAYARRAVVSEFVQVRERERRRLQRLVEGGEGVTSDAGAEMSEWESREWVMQRVRSLPPRQREAMACLIDGLSSAEAAVVLGQTPEAVRQNWLSARKRLRAGLEDDGLRMPAPRKKAMRKEEQ